MGVCVCERERVLNVLVDGHVLQGMKEDFIVVHMREPCSYCRRYIDGETRYYHPNPPQASAAHPACGWGGTVGERCACGGGLWAGTVCVCVCVFGGGGLSSPARPPARPPSPTAHPPPPAPPCAQKITLRAERTFDGISLDRPGSEATRTIPLTRFCLCSACFQRELAGEQPGGTKVCVCV